MTASSLQAEIISAMAGPTASKAPPTCAKTESDADEEPSEAPPTCAKTELRGRVPHPFRTFLKINTYIYILFIIKSSRRARPAGP